MTSSIDLAHGIEPARSDRYTFDGDDAVEMHMHHDQTTIVTGLMTVIPAPHFQALVLMGGYGRGEGGFFFKNDTPFPYNDYDYFIVTRGMDKAAIRAIQPDIEALCDVLEKQVHVAVDMAFLREEDIPHSEYNLMNAEMLWGHRVVAGNPEILANMPEMPISRLPLHEFTRLMHNRGTLLLMNQKMLETDGVPEGPLAREKFVKYMFKSVRAIADALLACEDRYHPAYAAKKQRLQDFKLDYPDMAYFLDQYDKALQAKFHPDFSEHIQQDLIAWQARSITGWLDAMKLLESTRLGEPVEDWSNYAHTRKDQSGSGLKSLARNIAITLRDYGPGEVIGNPAWSCRYPRERMISTLPLLLDRINRNPDAITRKLLALPGDASWMDACNAYLEQWPRYA